MKGKTVIVTGGNRGFGYETARKLAKMGANVVLGCRDESACANAKSKNILTFFHKIIPFFIYD